jgi:glycerophosphoryl diester phosphodiesterase
MTASRRDLVVLGIAAAVASGLTRAADNTPLIIAHGGSTPDGAQATAAAYTLAVDQGADFLGVDLSVTKDGLLVARPDNEISTTTDVAARSEFANRRTSKTIDGQMTDGWFVEDFTVAELKTLICRPPGVAARNRRDLRSASSMLTFQEVIDIARAGSIRTGRVVGVYAQMLHAGYFASIGLPMEERLADAIRANGYNSPAAAMFVQSGEVGALKAIATLSRVRCTRTLVDGGRASGPPRRQSAILTTAPDFAEVRTYARAVALNGQAVAQSPGAAAAMLAPLVVGAHEVGLLAHASASGATTAAELASLFETGIDGLITDAPAVATRARGKALARMNRRSSAPG